MKHMLIAWLIFSLAFPGLPVAASEARAQLYDASATPAPSTALNSIDQSRDLLNQYQLKQYGEEFLLSSQSLNVRPKPSLNTEEVRNPRLLGIRLTDCNTPCTQVASAQETNPVEDTKDTGATESSPGLSKRTRVLLAIGLIVVSLALLYVLVVASAESGGCDYDPYTPAPLCT